MSNGKETGWSDDERVWHALKYRIQAAHYSRSRARQQVHLDQALLYLNALQGRESVPSNLLTEEEAEMVIGAIPLQSGLLTPADFEQLVRLRDTATVALKWMDWWLDSELCECDGYGHVCGKTERKREADALRHALGTQEGKVKP